MSAMENVTGQPAVAVGDRSGRPGLFTWVDALGAVSVLGILVSLYLALLWAPTEAQMGDIQRIFYFHMPSAWVALGPCFTVAMVASILYLVKKDLRFDRILLGRRAPGLSPAVRQGGLNGSGEVERMSLDARNYDTVQVLKDGVHTGAKPGRALRGPGWAGPP